MDEAAIIASLVPCLVQTLMLCDAGIFAVCVKDMVQSDVDLVD